MLKIVRGTITPFSQSLGNSSAGGAVQASETVNYILGVYVNFWDSIIIIAFVIAIILMFISAYLIDASPFFIILYIILFIFTILFAPTILEVVNKIYEANAYAQEVALIPFLDFIRLNFGVILTVLGLLSMVIIYAKLRFGQQQL